MENVFGSAGTTAAAALLVAALLAGCAAAGQDAGSGEPGAAASSGTVAGLASPTANASPSPSPSPDPAPTSTKPPLERPTKKDPLRVYFGGDSLAGMPGVMLALRGKRNGVMKVRADYVECSRLTCDDPVDWPARVKSQLSAGHADVGVFMIGANDSGMPMLADGSSTWYPKKKWLDEYERRAKKIATSMLRSGVKRVYWVGMPIMPSSSESKKMRDLNELFEDVAASSPDIVYVDSYDLLAKRNGEFRASVRSGDGVHYTNEGADMVAGAVWEAMKRDWRRR
jgi:hypothetical protein